MRQACGLLDLVRLNTARIELLEAAAQSGRLLQKPARLDHARKCGALWSKSGTAEPMVRGLTAGGNRIRTIGPAVKETAVERGPAPNHCRRGRRPVLNDHPAYRSSISVRQQPRDPFVRAVPKVRIRFPPPVSLRTIGSSAADPIGNTGHSIRRCVSPRRTNCANALCLLPDTRPTRSNS